MAFPLADNVGLSEAALAEPGHWYMLRVTSRVPSLGICQPRLVDHAIRPREADVTRGTAAAPKVDTPMRAEFVVEAVLRRRGYDAWVPCESLWIRQTRYHRTRKKAVHRPIIAGFVLVDPGPKSNWPRLMDFPLIRGVVGFGGVPARIDEAGMRRLREIERRSQARTYQRMMPTRRSFEIGDEVEVLEGPFEGNHVRVVGLTAAAAEFEGLLFGRVVTGEISLHKVGKIG